MLTASFIGSGINGNYKLISYEDKFVIKCIDTASFIGSGINGNLQSKSQKASDGFLEPLPL